MGSGASKGKGRTSGKYKAPEPLPEASVEAEAKAEPRAKSQSKQQKETAYHRKNCTDEDLKLVHTINEAYPFQDDQRKTASKKEKVHYIGDGVKHDWGNVSVAKMQKKIICIVCKAFILDRYEEAPFFYCLRCKRDDKSESRHLEMCVQCYNEGALATAPREKISLIQKGARGGSDSFGGGKMSGEITQSTGDMNMYRGGSSASMQARVAARTSRGATLRSGTQSLTIDEDNTMRAPSPVPAMRTGGGCTPHPTIPSGFWKGKVTEGASSRPVNYKFFWDGSGQISGNGPENSELKGSITGQEKGAVQVKWTEKHDWGMIEVTAEVKDPKPCPTGCGFRITWHETHCCDRCARGGHSEKCDKAPHSFDGKKGLKGKFKASDGGGGDIFLLA